MRNEIEISTSEEELLSSTNDGSNRLFINGAEINSSEWIGSGSYTATVEGHEIEIAKAANLLGNLQLIRTGAYRYELLEVEADGSIKSITDPEIDAIMEGGEGGGGVTVDSYESLNDKPSIEGITLSGDKTFEDLTLSGITNSELENMLIIE